MAESPFPKKHSPLPNLEPSKSRFGTNERVGRWLHPTGDPRRCILEGTQFREKQALVRARSRLDRCIGSFHEKERGFYQTSGIVENLVGE
jgi:hypothetical protein